MIVNKLLVTNQCSSYCSHLDLEGLLPEQKIRSRLWYFEWPWCSCLEYSIIDTAMTLAINSHVSLTLLERWVIMLRLPSKKEKAASLKTLNRTWCVYVRACNCVCKCVCLCVQVLFMSHLNQLTKLYMWILYKPASKLAWRGKVKCICEGKI